MIDIKKPTQTEDGYRQDCSSNSRDRQKERKISLLYKARKKQKLNTCTVRDIKLVKSRCLSRQL